MRAQGRTISKLWDIITLTVYGLISDILHALDQGISSHIIANIFVEVMDSRFELNICIDMYSWSSKKRKQYKKTHDVPIISFSLSRFQFVLFVLVWDVDMFLELSLQ